MGLVIAFQVVLNLVTLYRYASGAAIADAELFAQLLLDVAALTVQLYLSGGATNPFISLFLLQVILGAVLLRPLFTWTIVAAASGCFLWLIGSHTDMRMPMSMERHHGWTFFDVHIYGMFICFFLAAALVVFFVTRINKNLRAQDLQLAELRRRNAEEEHIVRLGLLASGAAHELGTPLATLSVILNDWERMPELRANAEMAMEVGEMQAQVGRCKGIVSDILRSSGEARGESAECTGVISFIDSVVEEWEESRKPASIDYTNSLAANQAIASDALLKQVLFNVLDNAFEASPAWIAVDVKHAGEFILISVRDAGAGFSREMLADFGKPYCSTKEQSGRGLGLFLVVNVLRKLGGQVRAANLPRVGAVVELRLPFAALSVGDAHGT
jgi:two-component system sensor histidine kinase RegB